MALGGERAAASCARMDQTVVPQGCCLGRLVIMGFRDGVLVHQEAADHGGGAGGRELHRANQVNFAYGDSVLKLAHGHTKHRGDQKARYNATGIS